MSIEFGIFISVLIVIYGINKTIELNRDFFFKFWIKRMLKKEVLPLTLKNKLAYKVKTQLLDDENLGDYPFKHVMNHYKKLSHETDMDYNNYYRGYGTHLLIFHEQFKLDITDKSNAVIEEKIGAIIDESDSKDIAISRISRMIAYLDIYFLISSIYTEETVEEEFSEIAEKLKSEFNLNTDTLLVERGRGKAIVVNHEIEHLWFDAAMNNIIKDTYLNSIDSYMNKIALLQAISNARESLIKYGLESAVAEARKKLEQSMQEGNV